MEAPSMTSDKIVDTLIDDAAPLEAKSTVPDQKTANLLENLRKSRFDQLSIWVTVKTFKKAIVYCFMCYTMGMIEGWEGGVAGNIVVNKGFLRQFGSKDATGVDALNPSWVSAWGAMNNVGQFIAISFITYVANRFGRKITFYISWITFVIGLVCLTVARTPAVWMAGRLFGGIAGAIQQLTATPYVVEIAPTRIRGGLVTFTAVWSSITGIVLNLMLQQMNQRYPDTYILPVYVVWGLSVVMLACIVIIPESPWFLARRQNKDACTRSLRRLYGNVKGYDIEEEYGIIQRTLEHERYILSQQPQASWRDLFNGMNLRRTVIVTLFEVGCLLIGLSMFATFGTYFFAIAGESDPFLANLIVSIVNLVFIVAYCLMADKIGRRYPVTICFSAACLACWLTGILYYVDGKAARIVLVLMSCIWNGCYTILQNIYWLVAAELPSAQLRVKTGSCGLFVGAIFGLWTTFAVPPMLASLNLRAGFIWGATSLPVVVFVWYFLPESKGRSPAEIDELFELKVPAWRWSKTKTEVEEQLEQVTLNRTVEGVVGDV